MRYVVRGAIVALLLGSSARSVAVGSSTACGLTWVSKPPFTYQEETRIFAPGGYELTLIRQHNEPVEVAYGSEEAADHFDEVDTVADASAVLTKRFRASGWTDLATTSLANLECPAPPSDTSWLHIASDEDGYGYFGYYDSASFCQYGEVRDGQGQVRYRIIRNTRAVISHSTIHYEPPYGPPSTLRSAYRDLCGLLWPSQ